MSISLSFKELLSLLVTEHERVEKEASRLSFELGKLRLMIAEKEQPSTASKPPKFNKLRHLPVVVSAKAVHDLASPVREPASRAREPVKPLPAHCTDEPFNEVALKDLWKSWDHQDDAPGKPPGATEHGFGNGSGQKVGRRPFNANGFKIPVKARFEVMPTEVEPEIHLTSYFNDSESSERLGEAKSPRPEETSTEVFQVSPVLFKLEKSEFTEGDLSDFDCRPSDVGRGTGRSLASHMSRFSSAKSRSSITETVVNFSQMWNNMKMESRNKSGSRWLINPDTSRFLEKWDKVTILGLVWVALVAPVQISMLETKADFILMLNVTLDSVFVIDLCLQFFMMYTVKTDYGHELESRHPKIIRHYLRTWFTVDLISIIPFDLLALGLQSEKSRSLKFVKMVRMMRLLKLARVLKSSRVFRRFEIRMSITYGALALIRFFIILGVITHWLANLWAITLTLVDEDEGVPRWIDKFDVLDEHVESKTKDTPWKLYLTCFYFTSYTITSVGYGDIGPVNTVEMTCCTIMLVVSGLSWAVVLGQVCGVFANLNVAEQAFRTTMDELNVMMQDRAMPSETRRRLRNFFLSNRVAQKRTRHAKIIQAMSPGLRGEVVMQLSRLWINKVGLFSSLLQEASQGTDRGFAPATVHPFYGFIVELAQSLKQAFYAQAEMFGRKHVLYILNRGLVGRNIRIHQAGSVWGVDFMLSDPKLLEPTRAFTFTYVEVTFLEREECVKVLKVFALVAPELQQRVRRFCCWLALQRAIMREAKNRLERPEYANCRHSIRPKALVDIYDLEEPLGVS